MQRQPPGTTRSRLALCVRAVLTAYVATRTAPLHGQAPPARLPQFLRDNIGLDSSQLAAVERGQAVVKVLGTKIKRDVAVFGIIAADVSRDFYVDRLLDFPNSLRTPTRVQLGIFSTPATAADVQGLTANHQDVAEVKDCKPGECNIKMPASEMQRIREAIDWSAADPEAQANDYLRRRLVEYVTDYRARGDSAMLIYDDVGGVRASDAFDALLAQSPYVYHNIPSLYQYLAWYPHGQLDGVREVLFWSVDALKGLKPILSVTQEAVYAPPELPGVTVVAAKQIYADHYFEAGLDLLAVVNRPASAATPGIYLLLLRRSRFDDLPSGPIISIRGKVVGKLRDQMRADLEREKATTEQARQ